MENTGSSISECFGRWISHGVRLDMWYIPETWKSYQMKEGKWESSCACWPARKKWNKKSILQRCQMGFSEVLSNSVCLAQLRKLSLLRTWFKHVVPCRRCWWSTSVTRSWASRIWTCLGLCGSPLSELRALFRGFYALAEVEKGRLENKECVCYTVIYLF